jgi:hypothetical protein
MGGIPPFVLRTELLFWKSIMHLRQSAFLCG